MPFATSPRDRVVVEHTQIDTIYELTERRIEALGGLLAGEQPAFISDVQWGLLQQQRPIMENCSVDLLEYREVLEARLNAW